MSILLARRGDLLAFLFTILSVGGLALWFGGANFPEGKHTAAELAERLNSKPLALVGAVVLISAMVALWAYCRWLTSRFAGSRAVAVGAMIVVFGALVHFVENLLVLKLYSGDIAQGDSLWDVIAAMSNTAFGVIGVGVLVVALGVAPPWLKIWGVATGLLGVVAALSYFAPDLSFLPGPYNISLFAWMIVLGARECRHPA